MLHVPILSHGRMKCPHPAGSPLFWVGITSGGGFIWHGTPRWFLAVSGFSAGARLIYSCWSFLWLLLFTGFTAFCFCSPLGRHLCKVSMTSVSGFALLLGCWPTAILLHQWLCSNDKRFHTNDRIEKTNIIFLHL